MQRNIIRVSILAAAGMVAANHVAPAQRPIGLNPELVSRRNATEKALQSIAIVERKLMVPMRDGFDRNMNTGGKNYDEAQGVVAHNAVHHSKQYPSQMKITVVQR